MTIRNIVALLMLVGTGLQLQAMKKPGIRVGNIDISERRVKISAPNNYLTVVNRSGKEYLFFEATSAGFGLHRLGSNSELKPIGTEEDRVKSMYLVGENGTYQIMHVNGKFSKFNYFDEQNQKDKSEVKANEAILRIEADGSINLLRK